MTELQASRTLVKSPPELWAECSDAASLARHLDGFGEIRITRLEPETAVAWEGERARGTVRIEPAGWGTKVILTAEAGGGEVVVDAPPEPELPVEAASPEPDAPMVHALPEPSDEELAPAIRKRRFARFRAFWRGEPLAAPEPAVETPPVEEPPATIAVEAPSEPQAPPPAPEEPAPAVSGTEAALAAALDSLGQAHHRPYSRA
ncbi:MAG: hypothetical protein ACTHMY_01790 [Solirubrobacteraceae bacterium]